MSMINNYMVDRTFVGSLVRKRTVYKTRKKKRPCGQ